jgi:hypothetical protein
MKKLFFIVFLLSVTFRVIAPSQEYLVIKEMPPIEPFKKLMYAIGMVEVKGDTNAFNELEKAAGYFQIRPIRLDDFNIRTGNNYTMKDLFNYGISKEIFIYYATQIGPYDLEKIAKRWNGSGAKTFEYWERIKRFL